MSTRPLRRRLAAALTVIALAGGTAACGSSEGAETTADGKTVIRYLGSAGSISLPEIAQALGFLDDFELKYVGETTGGPESLRALATDQVDIANSFQGAITKVIATGVPITSVVASYGYSGDVRSSIAVRDDGSVKTARDLIGKKVALNTLGANAEAVLDTYLEKEGLSEAEIEKVILVPLPATVAESSLRTKKVDAAFMSGPQLALAEQEGGLDVLVTDTEFLGDYTGGSYAMTTEFLEENPEEATGFVTGIAKAIEWTQQHSVEEVREVASKYFVANDRPEAAEALKLWNGTGIPRPGGYLADDDFELWLDWLDEQGEIDVDKVDLSKLWTNEFNELAPKG